MTDGRGLRAARGSAVYTTGNDDNLAMLTRRVCEAQARPDGKVIRYDGRPKPKECFMNHDDIDVPMDSAVRDHLRCEFDKTTLAGRRWRSRWCWGRRKTPP